MTFIYTTAPKTSLYSTSPQRLGNSRIRCCKEADKDELEYGRWHLGSSTFEFRNGEYVEIRRYDSDESGDKTYELKDGKLVLVQSEKGDSQ